MHNDRSAITSDSVGCLTSHSKGDISQRWHSVSAVLLLYTLVATSLQQTGADVVGATCPVAATAPSDTLRGARQWPNNTILSKAGCCGTQEAARSGPGCLREREPGTDAYTAWLSTRIAPMGSGRRGLSIATQHAEDGGSRRVAFSRVTHWATAHDNTCTKSMQSQRSGLAIMSATSRFRCTRKLTFHSTMAHMDTSTGRDQMSPVQLRKRQKQDDVPNVKIEFSDQIRLEAGHPMDAEIPAGGQEQLNMKRSEVSRAAVASGMKPTGNIGGFHADLLEVPLPTRKQHKIGMSYKASTAAAAQQLLDLHLRGLGLNATQYTIIDVHPAGHHCIVELEQVDWADRIYLRCGPAAGLPAFFDVDRNLGNAVAAEVRDLHTVVLQPTPGHAQWAAMGKFQREAQLLGDLATLPYELQRRMEYGFAYINNPQKPWVALVLTSLDHVDTLVGEEFISRMGEPIYQVNQGLSQIKCAAVSHACVRCAFTCVRGTTHRVSPAVRKHQQRGDNKRAMHATTPILPHAMSALCAALPPTVQTPTFPITNTTTHILSWQHPKRGMLSLYTPSTHQVFRPIEVADFTSSARANLDFAVIITAPLTLVYNPAGLLEAVRELYSGIGITGDKPQLFLVSNKNVALIRVALQTSEQFFAALGSNRKVRMGRTMAVISAADASCVGRSDAGDPQQVEKCQQALATKKKYWEVARDPFAKVGLGSSSSTACTGWQHHAHTQIQPCYHTLPNA